MRRNRFSEMGMLINMGSPFLNLMAAAFLKIGTVSAMREAALRINRFWQGYVPKSYLKGSLSEIALEGVYWGTIAAVYVGIDYGMYKILGCEDWKNAVLGGTLTGAFVSIAKSNHGYQLTADAITGGAIAIAAELLNHLP